MRQNPLGDGWPPVLSGPRETVELFLWFLPGFLLWTALGVFLSRPLATFLATKRAIAFLLLVTIGMIVGATLSPTAIVLEGYGPTDGTCDLVRITPLSPWALVEDFDAMVNIILFAGLGFLLGLLPRTRRNMSIVVASFFISVVIELTQMALPQLGRGCESADVVDNSIGLVVGLVLGALASVVAQRRGPAEA